eukprot:354647-Chlamydomonas_euryale.AAC.3
MVKCEAASSVKLRQDVAASSCSNVELEGRRVLAAQRVWRACMRSAGARTHNACKCVDNGVDACTQNTMMTKGVS